MVHKRTVSFMAEEGKMNGFASGYAFVGDKVGLTLHDANIEVGRITAISDDSVSLDNGKDYKYDDIATYTIWEKGERNF